MSKKKFEFVIEASTRGWNSINTAQRGLQAFNRTMGNGNSLMAAARAQVSGLVGAYLGFNALSNVVATIKEANTAAFTLASSISAASREFDDTGSAESWGDAIERLSKKLRIYSKVDLQQGVTRTIDMTKRLGLSADEMEIVIARTADLSAGKTNLVDGIERVTAGLRGEAEAAEYLGLTLNENYIKSWYEARGAAQGAWKDLDDLQKAQLRYQVFLEQTNSTVGRAADSVSTLGGAYELVKAKLTDAIVENENMNDVLADMAQYLDENSEELGDLAVKIVEAAAAAGKWVLENSSLIASFGKWAIGIYAVTKAGGLLIKTFRALQAASMAMTEKSLVYWLGKLRDVTTGVKLGMGATFAATMGVAAAFVFAVVKVKDLIENYFELKKIQSEIAAQTESNAAANKKLADRFKEISKSTGVTVTSMKELDAAVKQGAIHFDEATGKWVKGYGKVVSSAKAAAEAQKRVTGEALKAMEKQYEEYADKIKKLQDDIAGREKDLYAQLRDIARTGMSDVDAWEDMKAQAEEYKIVAEAAADSGDFATAIEYADKAKELYASLNTEVKENGKVLISAEEARKTAMQGVKESGELAIEALKAQQQAAHEAMEALTEKSGWQDLGRNMDDAKRKWIQNWQEMSRSTENELKKAEQTIERLVKDETKNIYVNVIEKKSTGGLAGIVPGFATGGSPSAMWQEFRRLSSPYITRGSGLRDDVPAMLKRYEFIQPTESVKLYGLRFMEMVRRRLFPVSLARGFAGGGTPAGQVSLAGVNNSSGSVINVTLNYTGSGGGGNTRLDAKRMVDMVMSELQRRYKGSSK